MELQQAAAGGPTPPPARQDQAKGLPTPPPLVPIKASRKRYLILALYCLNAGNKSFQWIQLAAITTEAASFYGVDNYAINATAIVFMLAFVVLSLPACFAVKRLGLRFVVVLASFGTAVGSLLKCFSCHPGGIWLLMVAQVLVSLSEQLIYSVPSRLASVWFPDHQVSSAVALSILGAQMGIALGFQLAPMFLDAAAAATTDGAPSSTDQDQVGAAIYKLFLFTLALSVVSFVLDYFLFDERPEFAPGVARQRQLALEEAAPAQSLVGELRTLLAQIASLLRNGHLLLLVVSFGIRYSIGDTLLTLLDQTIKPLWPGDARLVGNIGCLTISGGALGLPLWGFLMDRFHCYKLLNLVCSSVGTALLLAFAYILVELPSKWGLFATAFWMGVFMAGSLVVSLEQAVELTYPAPEMVTSSLMNVAGPTFGAVFVLAGSSLVDNYSVWALIGFYLSALAVSLAALACSRETLNRQNTVNSKSQPRGRQ